MNTGKRCEPRKEVEVAVRIFGTDSNGKIFSEKASTVNVSRQGAALRGVQAQLKLDEIVGLSYAANKVHFRVKWVGEPGTPKAGQVGLLNISPEKPLWDFPVPLNRVDEFRQEARKGPDRRKHPRLKISASVEIHPLAGAPIWGKTVDLGLGGCFIEMAIPLRKAEKIKLGIWIEQTKLWAHGVIVTSTPGFGIGIKFTEISDADAERLSKYLKSIIRVPNK
ncbi:MAG: PilZ domain-containing protein [Terriglobales bacterium]